MDSDLRGRLAVGWLIVMHPVIVIMLFLLVALLACYAIWNDSLRNTSPSARLVAAATDV